MYVTGLGDNVTEENLGEVFGAIGQIKVGVCVCIGLLLGCMTLRIRLTFVSFFSFRMIARPTRRWSHCTEISRLDASRYDCAGMGDG